MNYNCSICGDSKVDTGGHCVICDHQLCSSMEEKDQRISELKELEEKLRRELKYRNDRIAVLTSGRDAHVATRTAYIDALDHIELLELERKGLIHE